MRYVARLKLPNSRGLSFLKRIKVEFLYKWADKLKFSNSLYILIG